MQCVQCTMDWTKVGIKPNFFLQCVILKVFFIQKNNFEKNKQNFDVPFSKLNIHICQIKKIWKETLFVRFSDVILS